MVKVFFQNSRAWDRREGKHLPHLAFPAPGHCSVPFLNNNSFSSFPGMPRLPLPFLRPGLSSPLFPFPALPPLPRPSSPHSTKSDNIDDEMDEEEEEEEEDDVPLDLSNKGSTPGASPNHPEREELAHPFYPHHLQYTFPPSTPFSSSDEEDNSLLAQPAVCDICSKVFHKKSSFRRHMSDHKGENREQRRAANTSLCLSLY